MINSIKINGIDINNFEIVTAYPDEYSYPIGTVTEYLKKYAGITLKSGVLSEASSENLIIVGPSSFSDGNVLKPYQTSISMKGTKILLSCSKQSSGESVVDMFIAKYLSGKGDISVNIPNGGQILYECDGLDWSLVPSNLSMQDRIVRSCKKLQQILEYDTDNGKPYTYEHMGFATTIDLAREADNRVLNCVIISNWVVKDLGLWDDSLFNILYDGTTGYQFESAECEKFMRANFDIINPGKTERELYEAGEILPGDIIFFKEHMQIYVDPKRAMDAGRGNTEHISCGSKFRFWLARNQCFDMVPGYIMRAKDASVF